MEKEMELGVQINQITVYASQFAVLFCHDRQKI